MSDAHQPRQPEILAGLRESDVPEMAARIMTVALRLFARQGYAATSVREIVQQSDVTNPTLYYYFENKAGLFSELVHFLFGSMEEELTQAIESHESFRDKLDAIAGAHLDASRRSPEALKFVYSVLFGPEEMRPEFDLGHRHARRLAAIAAQFDEAIEAGEFEPREGYDSLFLTQQFFGLLNSHLMRILKIVEHLESRERRETYLEEALSHEEGSRLVDFFLNGAGRIHIQEQ